MLRLRSLALTAFFCFTLTACGPRDHSMLAGTAIGAAAGAGISAIFEGDPLAGALVGGGLGALGGYAVDRHHHRPDHHRGWHSGRPRPHRGPHRW